MPNEVAPTPQHRITLRHAATALLFLPLLLTGCGGSTTVDQGGDAPAIGEVQSWDYDGPRARLVVGRIIDASAGEDDCDIACKVGLLTGDDSELEAGDVAGGIREMLTTALFNSGRYILLEREQLQDVFSEQALAADQQQLDLSSQAATLEGAELLLVGAITDFDMGESGGLAFPVPILFDDNRSAAIIDLEFRRSRVAMELRLIEISTGRILAAVAVEGKAWKAGAAMAGLFTTGGHIRLPGLLSVFRNTPVERAIQHMTVEATRAIVVRTPAQFLRHPANGPP